MAGIIINVQPGQAPEVLLALLVLGAVIVFAFLVNGGVKKH